MRKLTPKLPSIPKSVSSYLNLAILVFALIAIFAYFSYKAPSFKSVENIQLLARQGTNVCLAAIGMTFIIILGGIDLSVGSVMAFVAVVVAWLLKRDYPPFEAAAGGVLAGTLCGFVNGLLITRLKVVPFIVTLGMYLIVRGAAKGMAHEQKIDLDSRTWIDTLQNAFKITHQDVIGREFRLLLILVSVVVVTLILRSIFAKREAAGSGTSLVRGSRIGAQVIAVLAIACGALISVDLIKRIFPPGVWILIVLSVLCSLMLRYTRFGRHSVAVGSNEQAARLCGVPVERVKLLVYTLGGFTVGLSGLLLFSQLSVGDPTAAMGQELDVIAAVVIGGASLSGGQGSILGSLIGAIIMVALKAGGTQLGWANWMQEIITGAIIIGSVALDRLRTRREA